MRKVYLLFSAALLGLLPASAQTFERHPGLDAEVVFHQDFEVEEGLTEQQAYEKWSTTPVGYITELEYYSKLGSGTVRSVDIYDGSSDWKIFAVRTDSTTKGYPAGTGIVLLDGVETTSSSSELANGVYDADSWTIVSDGGNDRERNAAFEKFGEDGGKYYFKYTTGGIDATKISSSHYSTSTRSVKNYRRDLYVRGFDIEDETSYRLTFYIKAKKLNTWDPLFYADVMRGYHHCRKGFSMGIKNSKVFESSKDDFTGDWEKVTLMTYYINDSIADGYCYYDKFEWADDWTWRPTDEELAAVGKTLAPGEVLNYIKQPDKYFVRLSFSTDSVEYSLDNMSLTKSWIAGCEYDKDKLRVDFGYETNLADLALAAKAETNIGAVEIPDEDGKYFEVWCLVKGGDPDDPNDWEDMPIRSAEYHDDGYMYMFTDFYTVGNESFPFEFEDYDQVLVTFHNPKDDPKLTLKYTGSMYPKALDTTWVNNGKVVPDFYNEMATPNPYVFKDIHSLADLPPVVQEVPFEDGSFGLDGTVREFRFKFSRQPQLDDTFKGAATENFVAYVGDEVWIPSWDNTKSQIVITRPDDKTSPLKGDVEIKLIQIKARGASEEGEEVIVNYHFGTFDKNPQEPAKLYWSDWRSELEDPDMVDGCLPGSTWVHDCYSTSSPTFAKGDGKKASSKVRLYILGYPKDDMDNCGYYLASRQSSSSYTGNIYTIVNFAAAGDYIIKFKATGWDKLVSESGAKTTLKFYPVPDGNPNNFTFDTFDKAAGKISLGNFDPVTYIAKAGSGVVKDQSTGQWPVGVETFEFEFNVPTAGEYVFEWVVTKGSSSGVMVGNWSISNKVTTDLSTAVVKKLLSAVSSAQKKLNAVSDNKYKGVAYNALSQAATDGAAFEGHFPSEYDSVVVYINSCISNMTLRQDTVDLYYKTEDDASKKLASFNTEAMTGYKELDAFKALNTHYSANTSYDCSTKLTSQITAEIKAYEAEIKALDTRMSLIDQLNSDIKDVKALIDATDARKHYEEYTNMVAAYNKAAGFNVIAPTDSAVSAADAELISGKKSYVYRVDYYTAKTRQIKELFALADTLGYDFAELGNKDNVKATINALEDDDVVLSNAIREAAILQIYKIYAGKDAAKLKLVDSLDVCALVPNYFMYNDAQTGRDLDKSSSGTWRIIKNKDNTTAIPGWTLNSTGTAYPGKSAIDWEADGHVFIGGLYLATGTTGSFGVNVEGLPQAYYTVGMDMARNDMSTTSYKVETDSASFTVDGVRGTARQLFTVDSVRVFNKLSFTYIINKASSSGRAEMNGAYLMLRNPDTKADYAELATEQGNKFAQLVTLIDAPTQAKAGVEYFNLSGVKINNPKSGEIIIRRTVTNGKVVVDKVLIK